MWLESERCVSGAEQAIFQHRCKMRSIERNLLKNADREEWEHYPKKSRAAPPSGNQQCPAVDRRVPEHDHNQAVEKYHRLLKQIETCPRRRGKAAWQQDRTAP